MEKTMDWLETEIRKMYKQYLREEGKDDGVTFFCIAMKFIEDEVGLDYSSDQELDIAVSIIERVTD